MQCELDKTYNLTFPLLLTWGLIEGRQQAVELYMCSGKQVSDLTRWQKKVKLVIIIEVEEHNTKEEEGEEKEEDVFEEEKEVEDEEGKEEALEKQEEAFF